MNMINEPRNAPFKELFDCEKILRDEINRRAWEFLKATGYDWYKTNGISVIMLKRGKVDIIQITAQVELNHQDLEIKSEVTMTVFEWTLRTDFAS